MIDEFQVSTKDSVSKIKMDSSQAVLSQVALWPLHAFAHAHAFIPQFTRTYICTHTCTHMNYEEEEEEERGKEEEMRRQTKIYTQRSSKMIQISLSEPSFSL